mgnify:CR=1 FL=1
MLVGPVPQLNAEGGSGRDVVKVGIGQLADQPVDAVIELRGCAPKRAAFGSQLLDEPERMELALVRTLVHGERTMNFEVTEVKRGGTLVGRDARLCYFTAARRFLCTGFPANAQHGHL